MTKKKDANPLAPNKNGQTKDTVVAEWQATKRELVRVMIRYFHGMEFIDVRRWYYDAQSQLCMGKGISFRPADLKRVRKALRQVDRLINGDR